eukprot:jgi/Tetstr1/450255/TSEL_037292.t1
MSRQRCFPNRFPPTRPPGSIGDVGADRLRDDYLRAQLVACQEYVLSGRDGYDGGSVYTGAAGISLALCRLARNARCAGSSQGALDSAQLLARAKEYLEEAAPDLRQRRHQASLLCGSAGIHCTAALLAGEVMAVAQAQGSTETAAAAAKAEAEAAAEELRRHVEAYVSLQADAVSCQEDEMLYGRAGWLLGACMLNHHLGRGTVPEDITLPVLRALLASGRSLAARMPSGSPPLFFTWHDRPYLGAAHGLMGICYVLLHYWDAGMAVPHLHSDVEATIRFIMSLELDATGHPGPGGCFPNAVGDSPGRQPLVHWCHGAPGAVFLFCKAYEVLGHVEFREAAERAGAIVWRDGLLKKGPGLCHGVAGNGYALLALSRATGNKQYWYQAQQFAILSWLRGVSEWEPCARQAAVPI